MPRRGQPPALAKDRPCRTCGATEKVGGRCGPCTRRVSRNSKRRNELDPAVRLFRSARTRAQKEGAVFTITTDDIRAIYPTDGKCPALRIGLRFGVGKLHDRSPTLDRLNPARGYQKDNIAILSFRANRAKGRLTAEELEWIAAWMRSEGLA